MMVLFLAMELMVDIGQAILTGPTQIHLILITTIVRLVTINGHMDYLYVV